MVPGNQRFGVNLRPGHYVFLLAILFTVKDLYLNNLKSGDEEKPKEELDDTNLDRLNGELSKGIPGSRLSAAKFIGPSMKFLFWNAYDHYSVMIQERYPEIMLEAGAFPPPPLRQYLAQFISLAKFVILGCIIMNINPFEYIGLGRPNIWMWVIQNKIYAALMCFFLCNLIETQLISTGAFEIYFNDVPIWSKLQTGRIPSPPELLQIIDNHLKLMKNVKDFDDLGL